MNGAKWLAWLLVFIAVKASAAVSVADDAGIRVRLNKPAQRIVTLSPHALELVHAAGGLERVVGKSGYSFYPKTTRVIPEVSDGRQADIERILALMPDLVVAWRYGVSPRQIELLRARGIAVFTSDPQRLDDIPDSIVRLGRLLGTEKHAQREARNARRKLAALARRYAQRPPVRVFYQVSERPLYTLSDRHIVGEAIRLCGGKNIFGTMPAIAPQVSVELVLAANPQAIISTRVTPNDNETRSWRRYPMIDAVRRGKLFRLNPDLLDRPGPRMIEGVQALCEMLERAR